MNQYDETDEPTPAQVYMQVQQQRQRAAAANFVSPTPAPLATRQPQTIDQVAQWAMQAQPLDVANAWQPMQGAKETTSAVDRARGLQLRLWPFLLLYAGAGVVVGLGVWLVAGSWPPGAMLGALLFAALGVGTYIKLNGQDYDHSGAGVERHRISTAADLQREQMRHEQELKKMALDAYLRQLERRG